MGLGVSVGHRDRLEVLEVREVLLQSTRRGRGRRIASDDTLAAVRSGAGRKGREQQTDSQ